MSLKTRLIEQITLEGPISVADYMTQCLLDPIDGYYMKRPALGADGDFITAPMVSQMFGEMLGVWVAQVWHNLGSPDRFRLVEVGGGDGTLISDILRVADCVQRREHGFGEARALLEHGVDQLAAGLGHAQAREQGLAVEQVVEDEAHVLQRGVVGSGHRRAAVSAARRPGRAPGSARCRA